MREWSDDRQAEEAPGNSTNHWYVGKGGGVFKWIIINRKGTPESEGKCKRNAVDGRNKEDGEEMEVCGR